jgi:CHAT domain-containing protein
LHDGKLTMKELGALDLAEAELAYLSACSTAQTAQRIPDESIHVAAAFHLAGFRHVIGSLWPIDDGVAAEAARLFYAALPTAPSSERITSVLRDVAKELRKRYPDQPQRWAALVHSGA